MFSFVIVVFVNVQMNSPSGYLFYIVIFSLVISRELQNNNIIVTNICSAHIVCISAESDALAVARCVGEDGECVK